MTGIFITILFVFAFLAAESRAQVYYVASNGDDLNDGLTISTPWKTIAKVNSMIPSLGAGTQILFRRGDTFSGMISATNSGTAGNEIVFGSYGSGELPVISGAKILTGWVQYSGSIYYLPFTDTLSHLFANGKRMTPARFPNSRFLKTDYANSKVAFDDAELTQPSGYWNGSTIRVRTANWCYETKTVSSYTTGHVNFSSSTQYTVYPKAGYFFENKLFMLDTASEYFYDKSIGRLYFHAPGGVNPNLIQVQAVTERYGFFLSLSRSNVIIQDLRFDKFRENCVEIYTATNIKVRRCTISNAGKNGLRLNGSNHQIEECLFEDNLNTAITGVFTNGLVNNNTIRRTSLMAGYSENGWGGQGIQFYTSNGTVCRDNYVDSTGYTGLLVTRNMLVKNNYVRYSCLTLNDGAGIELNDADGIQIVDNVIMNTIGNVEASYSPNKYAMGIYFANGVTKNVLIKGNTIAGNGYAGINVDNKPTSSNVQILDNVIYNNEYTQIVMTDHSSGTYVPVYSNTVKGNLLCALSALSTCMEHQMFRSPTFSDYGDFDSNYYFNPYTEYFLRRSMVYGTYSTKYYRLPVWKSLFNEDLTSRTSSFKFDQFRVLDTLSSNMVINPRLETNILNWETTPTAGSTISRVLNPLLDTFCLKVKWTGTGGVESMTSTNYLSLTKNNFYFLRFDYAGNYSGDFSTFGRPNAGANPFLYYRRYLNMDTVRKTHSFVFKPDTTEPSARITFALSMPDTSLFIDNVYLYRVNAERIDSTLRNKLFFNPTNSVQVIPLEGNSYKDPDGTPVTGSITLQPFTSRVLVNDGNVMTKRLTLGALIEGPYNPSEDRFKQDTVTVHLRSVTAPYNILESATAVIDSSGSGSFFFENAVNGVNYYISVHHVNTLETWSSAAVTFISNEASYEFRDNATKAFGGNMILLGSRYCFFSGDVNQDGLIDATDVMAISNDAGNYVTGDVPTDVTGDNYVDGTDFVITNNNAENYVIALRP